MSVTTESTDQGTALKVEGVLNVAGNLAADLGGQTGQEANAALQGAEQVGNSILSSLAAHAGDTQTAVAALKQLAASASTTAAAVSPAAAVKVQALQTKAMGWAAELEAGFLALMKDIESI